MTRDEEFMKLALSLAAKGRTSPNPKVGAIIVKGGRIIGRGYHQRCGLPHAEIEAMKHLKQDQTRDAILYVTLEPCYHSNKKTPPCVPAIINAKFSRIVCATKDPNKNVNGKSINLFRKAGIEVKIGVCEKEARELNKAYIKYITKGLPYITMKVAMSLDGKIATKTGESKWISGEASRRLARAMRDKHDAVMVGIGTVLKDNPRLTCRFKSAHDPIRIIVDSKLRIPLNTNVLKNACDNTIIGCGKNFDKKKKDSLKHIGVNVFVAPRKDGEVNLKRFMKIVAKEGITSILLEGGSTLDGAMIDERLVDEFCFFIAPKIIGGKDAKTPIGGFGIRRLADAIQVNEIKTEKIGVDILITARIKLTTKENL